MNHKRKMGRRLACLLAALSCSALDIPAAQARGPVRPNILIIVPDELGFSELGEFGRESATPHFHALALKRFTPSPPGRTVRSDPTANGRAAWSSIAYAAFSAASAMSFMQSWSRTTARWSRPNRPATSLDGDLHLVIDAQRAGQTRLTRTLPFKFFAERGAVGDDTGVLLTSAYRVPGAYNRVLRKVTVTLLPARTPQPGKANEPHRRSER